tara:strand:+ start:8414 stop:8626 length:213 start_codon:yes stop_codon:yes gene_type:complete
MGVAAQIEAEIRVRIDLEIDVVFQKSSLKNHVVDSRLNRSRTFLKTHFGEPPFLLGGNVDFQAELGELLV